MRGLDLVGFALIGLGVVLVLAWPLPQYASFGYYSLADLSRPGPAVLGVLLILIARLRR
jgi:hypothetical protein